MPPKCSSTMIINIKTITDAALTYRNLTGNTLYFPPRENSPKGNPKANRI